MPKLYRVRPEQEGQAQGGQSDRHISDDHGPAAVPAVHVGTGKRAEDNVRHQANHRGDGEHGGRAGLLGHPPDQCELGDLAAEEGKGLPGPDGEKGLFPVWSDKSVSHIDHLGLSSVRIRAESNAQL